MSRRSELPDELLLDEDEHPEVAYSENPWKGRDPSEFDESTFGLLYALALSVWMRDVTVACRRRDKALVLAQRDEDGIYALKAGSESRWWLVDHPFPDSSAVPTYSVVMELDAPREVSGEAG